MPRTKTKRTSEAYAMGRGYVRAEFAGLSPRRIAEHLWSDLTWERIDTWLAMQTWTSGPQSPGQRRWLADWLRGAADAIDEAGLPTTEDAVRAVTRLLEDTKGANS